MHPRAPRLPRSRDLSRALAGAVAFAREGGASVLEGYPVDKRGAKVDPTMAYVGTKALFVSAGVTEASGTTSVLDGFPRVLVRLPLR